MKALMLAVLVLTGCGSSSPSPFTPLSPEPFGVEAGGGVSCRWFCGWDPATGLGSRQPPDSVVGLMTTGGQVIVTCKWTDLAINGREPGVVSAVNILNPDGCWSETTWYH